MTIYKPQYTESTAVFLVDDTGQPYTSGSAPETPYQENKEEYQKTSFGLMRVADPTTLFDSQFTYSLQPLLYEQITTAGGAVTFDATNRHPHFTITDATATSMMESYEHIRYQAGKSQLIRITFNFIEQVLNCLKFVGYKHDGNGYRFENTGTVNRFALYSTTSNGNLFINQADWNMDKLDGTGWSGITLDITKSNHFVCDFQALYVGRVRFGFDIGGEIHYCHSVNLANTIFEQYIATANLPLQYGMVSTANVTTSMDIHCATVISEGGQSDPHGYEFSVEGAVTAASETRTHLLSVRPKLLFNGIMNRTTVGFIEIDILVTGNNHVKWELAIGQAITGNTTFIDANTTYSSSEYNTLGTISGNPNIVFDAGYVAASGQSKGNSTMKLTGKYPVTLDSAGTHRANGVISILVTGIGGASACRCSLKFVEIR